MKILIIKLSSFGDLIHSLPVLNAIKATFPEATIDWLISEKFSELLQDHKAINNLYLLPQRPLKWMSLINKLKTQKYNYILDLQGLIKSGLIARLIGAKNIVGLAPARENLCEFFWTDKVKTTNILDPEVHVIERALQIIKTFGLEPSKVKIEFGLEPLVKENTKLPTSEFLILAPETRWESKNWPSSYWTELITGLLTQTDYLLVILGEGTNIIDFPQSERILDLRGKTSLTNLKSLLFQSQLVIGGDSGIIHLASALGKNTLGLFGPTSPKRTGPWKSNYLWTQPACSPCHKRKCVLEGANYLQCLYDLKAEMVLAKVKEILK